LHRSGVHRDGAIANDMIVKTARRTSLALAALCLAGGCMGRVADFTQPRPSIVMPQLLRFGYDAGQARCVGERLGAALRVHRLRDLADAAVAVRQGYYQPNQLTPRDLRWVASTLRHAEILTALDTANAGCGVSTAPPPPVIVAPPPPVGRAWLNLGRAPSGQSIAIDAATIEQEGATRSAWFRLTDPDGTASPDIFHLVVDCAARTINATERRRLDPLGNVVETRAYPDNPLPVENGTVMEIAWLSLCT
jgi:hypothetical protein